MIRLGPSLQNTLDQRPTQGLAMSATLAQAIGLLSMDGAELDAFVSERVDRNPFLVPVSRSVGSGPLDMATTMAEPPSLHVVLARQVAVAFSDAADRALAASLVAELDDAGYLRRDPPELADELGRPIDAVRRVLARCREFEPSGLFARDLSDCLTLQLRARGLLDDGALALVANLQLLATGDTGALLAATGLDDAGLAERLRLLRSCDPKPGAFHHSPPPPVRPVARIVRGADRGWQVRLVAAANPRVEIDSGLAARAADDPGARDFVGAATAEARWLQRALARRSRSIRVVVGEIATRQRGFLEAGEPALRPLSMRTVGDATGLHESTVSRVCVGKSVETPRGTFPLRWFFGSGVASSDGAVAARAVSARIRDLIGTETADRVLSDDALTRALRGDGIDVARRTVAKYRKEMAIKSSAIRRRELERRDRF